jgi:hypothetical protein
MEGRESLDVEELVRETENLRDQQRAVGEVLRAVARSEGLQPVLDAIIAAARRLCNGDHAQLYLAEGDVFVIVSQVLDLPDFEGRYDYAALGSVANLASRLSTHASAGQTLIGPRVFAAVEETVLTEPVGNVELKGFGKPVAVYEVRGAR